MSRTRSSFGIKLTLAAVLTVCLCGAMVGGYHHLRAQKTGKTLTDASAKAAAAGVQIGYQRVDVPYTPWADTTINDVTVVVPASQSVITADSIVLHSVGEFRVALAANGLRYASANPEGAAMLDAAQVYDLSVDVSRSAQEIRLRKLKVNSANYAQLLVTGALRAPGEGEQWPAIALEQFHVHLVDEGFGKETRAIAKKSGNQPVAEQQEKMLASFQDQFGSNQSEWPAMPRLLAAATLIAASDDITTLTIDYDAKDPVTFGELIQTDWNSAKWPDLKVAAK